MIQRKTLHQGEDGARVVLEGLPFTLVPDAARSLSGSAFKLLGRLQRLAGHGSNCEVENQDLARWIKRCTGTVQRALVELEDAGLISRRRRGGRRRIVLLYTLAGREASKAREALNALSAERQPSETSALSAHDQCNQRPRSMQSARALSPSFEGEREEEQQRPGGSAAAGVAPLCPAPEEESGSPEPPSRPAFLAGLVGDLAEILTAETRPAAGISPKNPRPPACGSSVPANPKCTENPYRSQDGISSTKHNSQT